MQGDKGLIDFVRENEKGIKKWLKWRPTVEGTYEDLLRDAETGAISVNRHQPGKEWDEVISKNFEGETSGDSIGGFYDSSNKSINLQKGSGSLPHEILHYFASHQAKDQDTADFYNYGTPNKINPYIKADMKLKGWLPSFHPGGRRPTMPGKFAPGKWWNKKMATKEVEYSNKNKYHPWFDEHSFDVFEKESTSYKEPSFRQAFKEAKRRGVKEFEWKGKKYHTKYKEKSKPKEESFLDRWKKSWAFRGSNY